MYENFSIELLGLRQNTVSALHKLGFTVLGNFIENDDVTLAKRLTRDQYKDLAGKIAELKAGLFWDEQNGE